MRKGVVNFLWVIFLIFLVSTFLCFDYCVSKFYQRENKVKEILDIPEKQPGVNRLSLVMVGDVLIHGSVYEDAKTSNGYDFTSMLSEMKPIISSYDLAFYNQESILGGTELGLSTYPRFNSPYEVGDALLDTGFNLVSLANNHTLDRGEQAILNSTNYWKTKDAYVAGSYSSEADRKHILIKEKNGIRYALLSYTCWTNGLSIPGGKNYLLNIYDKEIVKRDIESIRNKVDLLMVSMHFGDEYSFTPSREQKEITSYLAGLGVNIIIGHHPHVVQPIEFIDDTLVIYSLGNFLSGQRGIEKLTGIMVSTEVVKDTNTNQISLENIGVELTYTYTDNEKGYRGNYRVYPYTSLTEELLSNYKMYYNKYIEIVVHGDDRIEKSDYSGNCKQSGET